MENPDMSNVVLIAAAALLQYLYFTMRAGVGRPKYKVNAPKTVGNDNWERLFRVQQNTMEQLLIFIPSVFGFAYYVSQTWALILGVAFIIGRQLYSFEYISKPDSRVPGMLITLLSNAALLLGTVIAILLDMI